MNILVGNTNIYPIKKDTKFNILDTLTEQESKEYLQSLEADRWIKDDLISV